MPRYIAQLRLRLRLDHMGDAERAVVTDTIRAGIEALAFILFVMAVLGLWVGTPTWGW